MNEPALAVTVAIAVALPAHVLLILAGEASALVLLMYVGIAMPAVWSSKPSRRKAAAAVLHQILNALIQDPRR